MDVNKDLLWWYTFFDKKSSVSGIKNENISNKELDKELQERIITFFLKK